MNKLFVKYCGFTRKEDLNYAVSLGVDAAGFIFYKKSKRYISPERVREMCIDVPDTVQKVGVFVGESVDDVLQMSEVSGINRLQLFAGEIAEKKYPLPVTPVYRISGRDDIGKISHNGIVLLDTFSKTEAGGSGVSFDWEVLKGNDIARRALIAGGINAENVKRLLYDIHPYGIDVSSGIEIEKGIKSKEKMKMLMTIVEEYNERRE